MTELVVENKNNIELQNELLEQIIDLVPKPVAAFVPDNAEQQKKEFLAGTIDAPRHTYSRLEQIDFEDKQLQLERTLEQIETSGVIADKYLPAYRDFIERYQSFYRLMELAKLLQQDLNPQQRESAIEEYKALNVELFGEPQKTVFEGLVNEVKHNLSAVELVGPAAEIANDLVGMLPETDTEIERFKPSADTVEWMHEVAMSLYGGMLSHVPEREEPFSPEEVRDVFEEIIRQEFGESAEEWDVVVVKAKSINVSASEKLIKIPADRKPVSYDQMRDLVVHELGVHLLRSVSGEQTDLLMMQLGFAGFDDAEEGLGKVMEQALNGSYEDSGVQYYLIAGLMDFAGKSFKETHEIMWRYKLLQGINSSDQHITDEAVKKAKSAAYGNMYRMTRGTDDQLFLKDLSYYNGSMEMWQHLESIKGDDLKFMFVLMGRGNPASAHDERIMYETASA